MTCQFYDNCNHKDCEKDFCLKKYKLEQLYDAALLSDTQRKHLVLRVDEDNTDLETFKQLAVIEKTIQAFVAEGKNLYLHSVNSGVGKTSWALRLMQAYINSIWPRSSLECRALFISVPRFLLALKDNISNKNEYAEYVTSHLLEADLVIWDDIAAKLGTEFELNHLLSFIDARVSLGKSNIYTSNLNPGEIYNALGSRLASRICNLSTDLEFFGSDKRFLVVEGGDNI